MKWPLYISNDASPVPPATPEVSNGYFMQFDIIVKDSVSAPDTSWVFSTLVYDKNIKPGPNRVWDQMVPLGAQWGNDPQVNSAENPTAPLTQNWNNPAAPEYSTETLGWGQRLSGPNDGAINNIFYPVDGANKNFTNAKDSSCMSCHSSAQWNVKDSDMQSFLLPLTTKNPEPNQDGYLNSPVPGSPEWMKWFQNRKGNVPMDEGSVAGDFDMVLTFKTLPMWFEATQKKEHPLSAMNKTANVAVSFI